MDQLKNYRPLVKGVGLAIVNPHVMGRATDPSGGEPNVLCPSSGGGASYMQLAGAEHAPGGGAIYLTHVGGTERVPGGGANYKQPVWEELSCFVPTLPAIFSFFSSFFLFCCWFFCNNIPNNS